MSFLVNTLASVGTALTNVKENIEGAINPFVLSNDVKRVIIQTDSQVDQSFDEDSLFIVAENILNRATKIVDKVVQGSNGNVENLEEKNPKANFRAPLCTLKSISSELSCKPPGVQIAKDTALSILKKLPDYKWEAKAVLTLAAFAFDFGDFWLFAGRFESDIFVKQFAFLKNVPLLVKTGELKKHGEEFRELTVLIKKTLRVIANFDKFEKLSVAYGTKSIPELNKVLKRLPEDVYWTIVTIAAIATKFNILISEEPGKPHDIGPYAQKIDSILTELNRHLTISEEQKFEILTYNEISRVFSTPKEIVKAIKALLSFKGTVQKLIINGSKNTAEIDVLNEKNVFLFLSTLDITVEDIKRLKLVYERSKKEENFKILWIPVVEQWTAELEKKFSDLQAKLEIPLYIAQHVSTAAIKFVKEKWHFKEKPSIFSINQHAELKLSYEIQTITTVVVETLFREDIIVDEKNPLESGFLNIQEPDIQLSIKEGKYLFLYGGEDNVLVEQLSKKFSTFISEPDFKNVKFHLLPKTPKEGEITIAGIDVEHFWSNIQRSLITKAENKEFDLVTEDIVKLLSFKSKAWVVLKKGSTVITTAYGPAVVKVLEEVEKWKEAVKKKGFSFEVTFQELYSKVPKDFLPQAYEFELPVSVDLKCPGSSHLMETRVFYKCNSPAPAISINLPNAHRG